MTSSTRCERCRVPRATASGGRRRRSGTSRFGSSATSPTSDEVVAALGAVEHPELVVQVGPATKKLGPSVLMLPGARARHARGGAAVPPRPTVRRPSDPGAGSQPTAGAARGSRGSPFLASWRATSFALVRSQTKLERRRLRRRRRVPAALTRRIRVVDEREQVARRGRRRPGHRRVGGRRCRSAARRFRSRARSARSRAPRTSRRCVAAARARVGTASRRRWHRARAASGGARSCGRCRRRRRCRTRRRRARRRRARSIRTRGADAASPSCTVTSSRPRRSISARAPRDVARIELDEQRSHVAPARVVRQHAEEVAALSGAHAQARGSAPARTPSRASLMWRWTDARRCGERRRRIVVRLVPREPVLRHCYSSGFLASDAELMQ